MRVPIRVSSIRIRRSSACYRIVCQNARSTCRRATFACRAHHGFLLPADRPFDAERNFSVRPQGDVVQGRLICAGLLSGSRNVNLDVIKREDLFKEKESMGNNAKESFNLRAFASVFAGLSFVLMAVTGVVLFFAPSCRIARDTSWSIWGHDKDQWVAVHVWLSTAFIVTSAVHIYLNWPVLTNYFKSKIRKGLALRTEWVAALATCVVLYVGSVCGVAPFSSLMVWKETFKHGAAESGQGRRGGRAVGRQTQNSGSHAQPGHSGGAFNPNEHQGDYEQAQIQRRGSGQMGRKTLRQFCSDEGVGLTWAILRLRNEGFSAQDTMTMRQIADGAGVHPRELRGILALEKDH